jgi:hypothetical protein
VRRLSLPCQVHPDAFLVHRPHAESSSAMTHARSAVQGKSNGLYGHNLRLYNTVRGAV